MSLRAVHIFFILAAVSVCVFFGIWAIQNDAVMQGGRIWGIFALIAAASLLFYLTWFFIKTKKAGLS